MNSRPATGQVWPFAPRKGAWIAEKGPLSRSERRHSLTCGPWFLPAALGACAALLFSGCGGGSEGPRRFHVSGQVTWQGKPVPAGTVTFTPDVRKGNSGVQGAAPIRNGRYDTRDRDGRGTSGGPQIVKVLGYDGGPATETDPLGNRLFPEYQAEHDLPAQDSTLDLAVP